MKQMLHFSSLPFPMRSWSDSYHIGSLLKITEEEKSSVNNTLYLEYSPTT